VGIGIKRYKKHLLIAINERPCLETNNEHQLITPVLEQASTVQALFPYHIQLRDYFKKRTKTWNWFAEEHNKVSQIKKFKTELLKNTYRLDKEAHANLYAICDSVCQGLSIDAEVTLYQENNSTQLNAGISITGKEAHIVLSGNVLNLLSDAEFKALIGHELSHYLFFKIDNEEFEITQRIILALANDSRSDNALIETARIFQLYMELFCDLGAYKVCGDHYVTIQTLVKINTGLREVSAVSYVKQAEEILNEDHLSGSMHHSHPESYIRSIALKLVAENASDYVESIQTLIEGSLDVNNLDIFGQVKLKDITHDLLQCITSPAWINSSLVRNLCKEYFSDFSKKDSHKSPVELAKLLAKTNDSVKNYFSYVLLDFARVDASMESTPLAFTFEIAELLDIVTVYEKIVRKELKLTIRDFKALKKSAMADLQQIVESKAESLYDND